ncbi:hypothetical protein ONS95_005767 [Cadophora gregata]|uniref:uncharacterized protein n=1 Tax=Cadophora gregata TaxID=51156 RepID=UPI0026DC8EEA|nr:uncharacterized protein ONS95_005767 [Cadophora gregata]KAK0103765.1 hypothetical protein ONS95_005767 [Cadophora gregata]
MVSSSFLWFTSGVCQFLQVVPSNAIPYSSHVLPYFRDIVWLNLSQRFVKPLTAMARSASSSAPFSSSQLSKVSAVKAETLSEGPLFTASTKTSAQYPIQEAGDSE